MFQSNFYLKLNSFTLDVNLAFNDTSIIAVCGPSGSGKTTLLNCIAGLMKPDKGFLMLGKKCLQNSVEEMFVPPNKREVALVGQEAFIFPHISVESNLLYGYKRTAFMDRIFSFEQVIDELQLSSLLSKNVLNLSGGEKQKIAIARSILSSPKLLLLDEPVNALDYENKMIIIDYLLKIHKIFHIPIFYVSHSQQEINQMTNFLVEINNGYLCDFN